MKSRIKLPQRIKLYALMLSGLLLRLYQLGSRPMWYDEAIAVLVSRNGPGAIIQSILSPVAGSTANVHPPLYFTTLWAWMELFGQSPFAVRMLSVSLSLTVMWLLWRFGLLLLDRETALYAVALYAFSPMQVHYGQEARMYVMLTFFLLLATWALWRLLEEGKWAHWLIMGISGALAIYTHILALIYLAFLFMIPIFMKRWDRLRVVIVAGSISMVLYTPWLIQLPGQLNRVQGGYWIERPGFLELIQTLISFNSGLPLVGMWLPVGLALSVFIFALLIWRTYGLFKRGSAHSQQLLVCILLTFGPVALLFGISQIWPVYIIRGLLPSAVAYLLWLAVVLSTEQVKRFDRGVIAAIIVALFSLGLLNHYQYRDFPYAPFESMNQYLSENLNGDGTIVHSNKITMLPAYYYNEELPHTFLADRPDSGSDTLALPTQEVIGILEESDLRSAVKGHKQVFLVIFEREIFEYQQAGLENHPNLKYLQTNYKEQSAKSFGDVLVYEFREISLDR